MAGTAFVNDFIHVNHSSGTVKAGTHSGTWLVESVRHQIRLSDKTWWFGSLDLVKANSWLQYSEPFSGLRRLLSVKVFPSPNFQANDKIHDHKRLSDL